MSVDRSRDELINLQGWPTDAPPYSFSDADLGWESEEKKALLLVAASRAWDVSWVGNDEGQILELEVEVSDGSVRPLDSDDESEDGFLRTTSHFWSRFRKSEGLPEARPDQFPVPDELTSEEEGGGEEGGEEGSKEGGEDSEEDVPLAQRKVARV